MIFIHNIIISIKDFISKYKSYLTILIIIILSVFSIVYQNINSNSKIKYNEEEISLNSNEGKIAVYITGEVNNPGVYYVDNNSRIIDLLEECGGVTSNSDLSDINLAQKLEDSDKIDIPTKIDKYVQMDETEVSNNVDSDKININTASKDELMSLNGIGDTLAQNIIDYRNKNSFESIEDILNVNGIGQSKYEKIKEYIPTAKESFQVLEGTKIRVNEEYSRPLLSTFEMFESYMKAWNPEREMEYGLFRIPIPEFSEAAFREGLVNAFCHRDYTMLQSVRVAIEDEGLTISSPGGFIEGVTLENLLTVEPHSRNPVLTDALKRIGLAEKTGRGIDRIFEGSIIYGRPLPDYSESTTKNVKLFIPRSEPDLPFTRMISNEENRLGRSLPINSLLILSALQSLRRASLHELAEKTHIIEVRVKANVEKLLEAGLVDAIGNTTARTYLLSSKVYREQENMVGYVRQTGIDLIKYEELVLKLAVNQNGIVTRDNVVDLLGINTAQAYRVLKKISENGKLKLVGHGRASHYELISKDEI